MRSENRPAFFCLVFLDLFSNNNALNAYIAIVVINIEEVNTSFNIHVDNVSSIEFFNADQLTSYVVDSNAAEVFTFDVEF